MALPVRRSTEVASWNPFRELDDLHERMSRLLESSIGWDVGAWTPGVDLEETDEAFVVEAELPGVKPADVSVDLRDPELTIHGELKERERTGILHRQTRRTGRFDYRVLLPGDVDADAVSANLADGVLRVQIRKADQARTRRIEVTAA